MHPTTTLIACFGLALACPAQSGNWVQMNPATSPSARFDHAMAYDSKRGRTVMFGGTTNGYVHFADTWEWDGKNWALIKPATSPSARSDHAMVYDAARGRTMMFGGYSPGAKELADTWEWDGKNWVELKPATSPPARFVHAMVYDSARGRVVMFGGTKGKTVLGGTWEWDGKNWALIKSTTSPPARSGHAMAYDSSRGRTVVFGGFFVPRHSYLGDTWEWDGKNWMQIRPATSPFPQSWHAMVYDSDRGSTVMFGGQRPIVYFMADTWDWNGKNWSKRKIATAPLKRQNHAMVYDSARGRIVMFGGYYSFGPLADTWEHRKFPASYTAFGKGCSNSAGVPKLVATTLPIQGKTFTTSLSGIPTPGIAYMILGLSDQQWGTMKLPLDMGFLKFYGCKLFVSGGWTLNVANRSGTAWLNLPIPGNNPWLLGRDFFLQGAVVDSRTSKLGFSDAGKATIGY